MEVKILQTQPELEQYDLWVKTHPHGSLWQSLEWKKHQEALGREVKIYVGKDKKGICASALVVIDRTNFGFSTWEIPRGPLGSESGIRNPEFGRFIKQINNHAKETSCFAMYFSPPTRIPNSGFRIPDSNRHQQPAATLLIDLTQSEEQILTQMKPKGRYNIKVAQKHGVETRQSKDVDAFYELIKETAKRDKFKPLPKSYYRAFVDSLEGSFLFLAYLPQHKENSEFRIPNSEFRSPKELKKHKAFTHKKKPISGLLGVVWEENGIYYYGASSYAHKACMAPYLLQWEAIRFCKEKGCTSYDLFGIAPPDEHPDTSNKLHPSSTPPGRGRCRKNHPWKGVTAFKEKFGGEIREYPEEKVVVLKPAINFIIQTKRKLFS